MNFKLVKFADRSQDANLFPARKRSSLPRPTKMLLTAELHGILMALKTWYNNSNESSNLFIFTDSKAAIQAINAVPKEIKSILIGPRLS